MPRFKLNDQVTINKQRYIQVNSATLGGCFPVGGLLDPAIAKIINTKIESQEVAKIIFTEKYVVDLEFPDGFTTTIERSVLDIATS